MKPTRDASGWGSADPDDPPIGQVYAFVSAKGGVGKTLITFNTASLLARSGCRVLLIDTDLSTRGLSLFVMGSRGGDTLIRPANAIGDSFQRNVAVESMVPLAVPRDGVTYHMLFANSGIYRGKPEAFGFEEGSESARSFIQFFRNVCEQARKHFDYVLIDTRGGYDLVTGSAARLSNGYIIVVEADKIAIDQVDGFKKAVDAPLDIISEQAILKGFIINKALFSIDEELFPDQLARFHSAPVLATIPVDRDAVRAYQNRMAPTESSPDADFSFYATLAVDRLIAPSENWERKKARAFEGIMKRLTRKRSARRLVAGFDSGVPLFHLALVTLAALAYFLDRSTTSYWAFDVFYSVLAMTIVGTLVMSFLRALRHARTNRWGVGRRRLLAWASLALMASMVFVLITDLPSRLSRDSLISANSAQRAQIARYEANLRQREKQLLDMQTRSTSFDAELASWKTRFAYSQDRQKELEKEKLTAERAAGDAKGATAFFEDKLRILMESRDQLLQQQADAEKIKETLASREAQVRDLEMEVAKLEKQVKGLRTAGGTASDGSD